MEESLLFQIKRLRRNNKNFRARLFLPELSLHKLMQKESVCTALAELKIEHYRREELAREIVQRARKVFAILLLIGHGEAIEVMFKHDSLQQLSVDAKLPFSERSLQILLGNDSLAGDFFERQWELITPVFSHTLLPREFEGETILPFLGQEPKGDGSFGEVWEYDIHPENHRFSHAGQKVRQHNPTKLRSVAS